MIKLFVFLGNPGKKYSSTRHNAGYIACDMLFPSASWQTKFNGSFAKEGNIMLLKPLTFMNLSGTSVSAATSFFHLKSDEVVVFHDDLELPLGTFKMEKGGPLHGHNGLRSIKERLGSDGFYHVRIGIGRPKHGDVALYVTTPFINDEMITLSQREGELKDIVNSLKQIK